MSALLGAESTTLPPLQIIIRLRESVPPVGLPPICRVGVSIDAYLANETSGRAEAPVGQGEMDPASVGGRAHRAPAAAAVADARGNPVAAHHARAHALGKIIGGDAQVVRHAPRPERKSPADAGHHKMS